ncbi:MAG: prolyl oligopeptidase family serine peptidase [Acidobacteriota bacterium]|nr:prolyl oligopeptidase family serine peptidase [Acidobacteriota bacterium]
MRIRFTFIAIVLSLGISAHGQQINREKLIEEVEKQGCAVTEDGKVKVCKFDYKYKNRLVEALTFRPNAEGKFPGLFLVPGYQGTAKTYLGFGIVFAKLGFASVSVGTPGFGRTELKPDFLGPNTISAFIEGYRRFRREPFVDKSKLGVFGYSRGAIAASLMITRLRDVKAAVVGGGIYDLKRAYDELTIEGIKENIRTEAGLSDKAMRERSAFFRAKNISSPVLIIHGEKDQNAPTDQAYLFNDELKKFNKDVELKILPNHSHGNLGPDFLNPVIDFFSRKLEGKPMDVKVH